MSDLKWRIPPRHEIGWWHRLIHRLKWGSGRVTSWPTNDGYCIGFECAECGGVPEWSVVDRKVEAK